MLNLINRKALILLLVLTFLLSGCKSGLYEMVETAHPDWNEVQTKRAVSLYKEHPDWSDEEIELLTENPDWSYEEAKVIAKHPDIPNKALEHFIKVSREHPSLSKEKLILKINKNNRVKDLKITTRNKLGEFIKSKIVLNSDLGELSYTESRKVIKNLPIENYKLKVIADNYQEYNREINLEKTNNVIVDLRLKLIDDKQRIKEIQKKLSVLGYKLKADGLYGKNTREKIIEFRKDYTMTGIYRLDRGIDLYTYNKIIKVFERTMEEKKLAEERRKEQENRKRIKDWVEDNAYFHAKEEVKKYLKAPSTAKFPWWDYSTYKINDNRYKVASYVDAQNGFGAMVRTYYSVTFNLEVKGDTLYYSIVSVDID